MANATCGCDFARLDVAEEFRTAAREAREQFGASIWLNEIFGRRWSYVAGERPDAASAASTRRIRLGDRWGLVATGWERVPEGRRKSLVEGLRDRLRDAEQNVSRLAKLIEDPFEDLVSQADAVRQRVCGEAVHIRGIVEFSNRCSRNCLYCGMRRGNAELPRYAMSDSEIVETAARGAEAGLRTIVLQSGEYDGEDPERLARVVEAIKAAHDVAVTLSVGVKPASAYRLWRSAGADRFLLKHETTNPRRFARLRPGCTLAERVGALETLRKLGYQTGAGSMVGLPDQTVRDLAEDIALAQRLDVDMASFGPFVPHPKTPLANNPPGGLEMALRVVAAARIALGAAHIPATTSMDAIAPDGRERALQCGANVLMVKLTPARYRAQYDIYPGAPAEDSLAEARSIIKRLGRPEGEGYGHSMKVGPQDGGNR